jgi:hypothetical protein
MRKQGKAVRPLCDFALLGYDKWEDCPMPSVFDHDFTRTMLLVRVFWEGSKFSANPSVLKSFGKKTNHT